MGLFTSNMGILYNGTRDLDERKDTEIVVPERENTKVNYLPPPLGTKRRKRFYRKGHLWCNVLIFSLLTCFIVLHEFNILPHFKSGFYCGDPKISFKFEGDTITVGALLIGCSLLPLIAIIITELVRYRPEKYTLSNVRFKTALQNTKKWYGEYILSMIFNLFFTEVVKGIIGEPRPHFLDTCIPDAAVNCTPGLYISTYKCTNEKFSNWFVMDTIKSFPSGHTSLSLLTGIYLFCYFHRRLCDLKPKLLGPILQMLAVAWGLTCSFTRISDNRHHWWDVLAGAVIGIITSYYSIMLCKDFECSKLQLSRSITPNGDSGISVDNHNNTVKKFMNTPCVRPENYESGRQIT